MALCVLQPRAKRRLGTAALQKTDYLEGERPREPRA